ncbi:conserved hypothetical protein [Lausannevirus]|uniref:Uncharacterized protein n=2 Tax=Lausannevirus TaxID=999883 RepID=A0A0N9PMJ1_9VIRU|nr:hypothetical protein LAU_0426 [Lausannevirus]AEA07276.1 conserved hypothetical protein [Lausannevirus]ALH07083.1 hypothetical protein PMV_385 [Port-miou virus]
MKVFLLRFKLWLYEKFYGFQLFDESVLSSLSKQQRGIIRKAGILRVLSSYAPVEDGDGSDCWLSSYQSVEAPRKLIDLCIRRLFTIRELKSVWLLWLSSRSGTKREITDFPHGCRKPSLQTTKVLLSSVPGFLFTDNVCLCVNHDIHCKLMTLRTVQKIQKIFRGKEKDVQEKSVLQDTSDFENSCFPLDGSVASEEECLDMVQGKGIILYESSWCVVKIFEHKDKVRVYGFPQEENTWIYYLNI